MKENFIAFGPTSLYAGYKGNTMSDGPVQTPEKDQMVSEPAAGVGKKHQGSSHIPHHKPFHFEEHVRALDKALENKQVVVSRESQIALGDELVRRGLSRESVNAMDDAGRIAKSMELEGIENAKRKEEIKEKVNVIDQENIKRKAEEEGAKIVGDIESPHIIIETKRKAEYIKGAAEAAAFLKDKGVQIELPANWEKMAIVKRWRFLMSRGVYEFEGWTAQDAANIYVGGELPAIRGGSGDIDWEVGSQVMKGTKKVIENGRMIEVEVDDLPINFKETIRRLVILKEKGADTGAAGEGPGKDWDMYMGLYKSQIEEANTILAEDKDKPRNYAELATWVEDLNSMKAKYNLLGAEQVKLFRSIVSVGDEGTLKEAKGEVGRRFRELVSGKTPDEVKILFREIESAANQVISVQRSGWYGRADDYRATFDKVAEKEIADNPEFEQLLSWKAQVLREGFDLQFADISAEQPPADWHESERNVDAILRLLESSDFGEQQLSQKIQKAAAIVLAIPEDLADPKEKEEAGKLRKRLTEKYESVISINQFYSAMETSSMDPEKVMGVFNHFKDNTFQSFFERFTKDNRGKELELDEIDPETGKKKVLNLLDVGMQLYMKRFHKERLLMNFVESWTRDRNIEGQSDEEKEALKVIKARIDDVHKKVYSTANIKDAVSNWYGHNTLLGTMKEDEQGIDRRKDEMLGDKSTLGEDHEGTHYEKDGAGNRLWNEGLLEELLKNQKEWNLTDQQIREMVDSGLLDQVVNNAHRLSWTLAWSDYDGIRIWDPDVENPAGGRGRQVAHVYNQSTDFFYGRMVDHTWEFYIDEKRGKVPKTNFIMQDELLGEAGNLLPQNRTMVRFASELLGDQVDQYIEKHKHNFKNIDKFSSKDPEEMAWARAAMIAEGIDKGEISFAKASFSKCLRTEQSVKYKMIDLYGDRDAMKRYIGDPLQEYLETPNSALFMEINSKKIFYSKRMDARLQPWLRLVIPSQIRTGKYWKAWWGLPENMLHAEKEEIIEAAADTNRLNAEYKDKMKHDYLGWFGIPGFAPIRATRQVAQSGALGVKVGTTETAKSFWWRWPLATTVSGFGQGVKYVFS